MQNTTIFETERSYARFYAILAKEQRVPWADGTRSIDLRGTLHLAKEKVAHPHAKNSVKKWEVYYHSAPGKISTETCVKVGKKVISLASVLAYSHF